MAERLFLLDGTALAYRAFFAFIRNPLFDGKGRNISAVYGFTSTLFKLLETEKPEHVGVAFDPPGPTFRHERFAEYKATRQKMPDEMAESLPAIREIVAAFRIPIFELPGYEADDVLGTLSKRAEAAGVEVLLVTGDKDLTQLVTDRVRIYNVFTRGGETEVWGPAEVREKFGVPPSQVVDFLGLTGDTSDNIPGVPGIGAKTAVALLAEYGSMDALLERAGELKAKRAREGLQGNRERALLSRELARIRTDVPIPFDLGSVRVGKRDEEKLVALFREYQMNSFLPRLRPEAAPVERRYHTVRSEADLDALIALLRSVPRFVLDTETTGLDPLRADVVGLSFSVRGGAATYVPLNLDPPFLPREAVLARLRPVLEDPAIGKAGQNIKYDLKVLGREGIEAGPVCFDTMVASFLLDPAHREHNLDALAMVHLNLRKIPTTDIIGKGKEEITMAEAPVSQVAEYACEDAEVTWRLMELFEPRLAALNLDRLNREVEVPLVEVLARIERTGVLLDVPVLTRMSATMAGEIVRLEEEIQRIAGVTFNVNSPPQLGAVLFENLKIHEGRTGRSRKAKTTSASGQYATDQETLSAYADHPIVKKIFEYREYVKLKGTYVDALPAMVNPETGRVHANYHQAVAITGRLSASDPNLQNIPIRTEVGREIRTAFIAPEGSVLVSADYSQIELRVLAHLSGDETLCSAFREGKDIHTDTASRIFGVAPGLVTSELRGRAKAINFGIVYGMGPQRLSRQTGMSLSEAREFIEAYFRTYPRVRAFQEECRRQAREEGFVQTLLGRRRHMKDEINSSDGRVKANAENIAINTPIQGTAADLIKVAMIRIDARIRRERLRTRMIIQVHDELVLEVPEDERDAAKALVRTEMEGALTLAVPIAVGLGVGPTWLAAH
jgi:DNA polymerase-1